MARDKFGRFCKASDVKENNNMTTTNNVTTNNNTNGGSKMNRESRMEVLKANGIATENFFDVNVRVPMGASIQILVDGQPYTLNTNGNEVTSVIGANGNDVTDMVSDKVVEQIVNNGYVFNRKTDSRWACAQTFRMLTQPSYNFNTRQYETGWDAYLRNYYGFLYVYESLADELHRLAKMERQNDPELEIMSRFFTKEVVYDACKNYIRQLKKFVNSQKIRKCRREKYVRLNRLGNVFLKDLNVKLYSPLEDCLKSIESARDYAHLERYFNTFRKGMIKLPFGTAKPPVWKSAFKAKGSFQTLNNIIKHHGVHIIDPETGEVYNTIDSVNYVERKAIEYTSNGEGWRLHELMKYTIKANNFDLAKSIEAHK